MITSNPSTTSSTPMDLLSVSLVSGSSQTSNTKLKKTPLGCDMISNCLVQYVPQTPKSHKIGTKCVTGAQILTSAQSLAILEERKEKKIAKEKEKKLWRIDKKNEELARKNYRRRKHALNKSWQKDGVMT